MKFKGILFALAGALIFTGLNDTVNAAAPAAPKKYDARTTTNKINALINISAERDIAKIKAMLADYRKDASFNADALYTFDLIEAGLNAKGNAKAVKIPVAPKDLDASAVEKAFFSTAKVFMQLRDYPIARDRLRNSRA